MDEAKGYPFGKGAKVGEGRPEYLPHKNSGKKPGKNLDVAIPPSPKKVKDNNGTDYSTGRMFDKFIDTFESNGEARNFVAVKTDEDGNFVSVMDKDTLEEYAKNVLNGGADVDNLQVGEPFIGEDAEDKAEDAADKLMAKFAPPPGATDEELAEAAVKVQGADIGGAVDLDVLAEEGMDGAPSVIPPLFGGSEEYNAENAKLGAELPEDDPMLAQLRMAGGQG